MRRGEIIMKNPLLAGCATLGMIAMTSVVISSRVHSADASDDSTAQCLADCKKKYQECSDGGTKNVTFCLAEQKKCISTCS